MSNNKNPLERAQAAISIAQRAIQKTTDSEDRIEELEQEVAELRHQLEEIRERDAREERLFGDIRKNMANKPEKRAATLIQALNNEALTDASIGGEARAEMDVSKARTALGGSVIRQVIYPTFERAVELIDDEDVLEYTKEDRGSDRNSRLRLNLEGDRELPEKVAGCTIRDPPAETATGDGG